MLQCICSYLGFQGQLQVRVDLKCAQLHTVHFYNTNLGQKKPPIKSALNFEPKEFVKEA